jgi:hypothetical protein
VPTGTVRSATVRDTASEEDLMKRRVFALVVGALMVVGAAVPAVTASSDVDVDDATDDVLNSGQFTTVCMFSHRLSDDPIIYPRKRGASHSHDFFGNRSTNAFSTLRTLQRDDVTTSCRRPGDKAAYWVPSLYLDGRLISPRSVTAYYQARNKAMGTIQSFPQGLKLIAGDVHAMTAQRASVTVWHCAGVDMSASSTVPTCPTGSHLVLRVRFPDCWNGQDLDSENHKSHLAYNYQGRCPATHPVGVPGIALNVHYLIAGGPGVTLASGSPFSGHADFFNAWDAATLKGLVDRCLNTGTHCAQT